MWRTFSGRTVPPEATGRPCTTDAKKMFLAKEEDTQSPGLTSSRPHTSATFPGLAQDAHHWPVNSRGENPLPWGMRYMTRRQPLGLPAEALAEIGRRADTEPFRRDHC